MTATALRWPVLSSVLFTVACATFWAKIGGGDSIKAPHSVHARAKIDCLVCHESIYDATNLKGDFLPKEQKCLECHEDNKKRGECGYCHTDVTRPTSYRREPSTLKLAHAKHIELTKEDCSRCHKTLSDRNQPAVSPTMDSCLDCHPHRQQYDQGSCATCHKDLKRYPQKPITMFSHQGNFVTGHARPARSSPESCATCHEQTFCADCHSRTVLGPIELKFPERVDSDLIHRGDFLVRHSIESRADPASCLRCHGTSFCENCHKQQGVSGRSDNPRNPHAPGFTIPNSPQFHGLAARRNISSCASCHDQGPRSNCVNCHKVGGLGGNPHPPEWTERHDRQEILRNGMCRYCHTP